MSFICGIIGIFLPVVPTTPFFILSAYLFSKSSTKFHAWIMSLPFAGPAIEDWNLHRVVRPRAKVLCASMILISLMMLWSFAQVFFVVKMLVSSILISVAVFVVSRKSH